MKTQVLLIFQSFPWDYVHSINIGVGGMNEGLQILFLGIIFQRLHHKNKILFKKWNFLVFGGWHQKIIKNIFYPKVGEKSDTRK